MPREKEGEWKSKGAPLSTVPILQKFLKTQEKHCAQTQVPVCPAITKDLKTSINNDQILRKVNDVLMSMLVRPDDSLPSILPISLEPLLMTIQDECYTLGNQLCVWDPHLSNLEITRFKIILEAKMLRLFLERKGHTPCPLTTLELIDCKMSMFSGCGQALQFSSLHPLVLDFCKFENEEIESIFSGLESNQRLHEGLSPRYCGLGPQTRASQGSVTRQSAICEYSRMSILTITVALTVTATTPIAEESEIVKGPSQPTAEPHGSAPGLCDNQGPQAWRVSAPNLIKYSAHLRELDLGNNSLGEMAAADILEALRARIAILKITVTPPISSDTFRSIGENSKRSNTTSKKKKKVKK
ncbi:LOW QUALITY PROTEIN: uncharacterized protein AAES06_020482 [Glossophaga mutica]